MHRAFAPAECSCNFRPDPSSALGWRLPVRIRVGQASRLRLTLSESGGMRGALARQPVRSRHTRLVPAGRPGKPGASSSARTGLGWPPAAGTRRRRAGSALTPSRFSDTAHNSYQCTVSNMPTRVP